MRIRLTPYRDAAMKAFLIALACALCVPAVAVAEDSAPTARAAADSAESGFVRRVYTDEAGEHRYSVYLPRDYSPAEQWPVILYLHGAGVSGARGDWETAHGLGAVIKARGYPAIVVMPQCDPGDAPLLERWSGNSPDGRRALRILQEVEESYSIDPQRRILAGWSMGGYGAWSLAAASPEKWSAVVAVSGGGDPELASQLTNVPIWAIHGVKDRAVLPEQSQSMANAVNAAGGRAECTILPGVAHDAWKYAFASRAVIDWMLDPADHSPDVERLLAEAQALRDSGAAAELAGEFRPALIMPRAVSIRLENEALRTIGYGLPAEIDAEHLSGAIEDQHFTFTAAGETFEITQADLSYAAHLQQVLIAAQGDGTVRVQIGLRPLTLRIGETRIFGTQHQATAGPVVVRLGHRRPVWINLTLEPAIVDHELRLVLRDAEFRIPDDNWHVSRPEEVTVAGADISPELVKTAIVGGLYLRRAEVEECVARVLPALVESAEEQLHPLAVDRVMDTVWPLPVFQPRLRLQFEELQVDANGISVVAGLEAAALTIAEAPAEPRVLPALGPAVADVPRARSLEVSFAPGILEALSTMVVEAHVARIDVRDMPDQEFAALGDRTELARIFPELEQMGRDVEFRTELDVAAPFAVSRDDDDNITPVQFTASGAGDGGVAADTGAILALPTLARDRSRICVRFHLPRVLVNVEMRAAAAAGWTEYASFDVSLAQTAAIQLARTGDARRVVRIEWLDQPEISVQGGRVAATDMNDVHREHLAELLHECWTAWTAKSTQQESEVPDLEIGDARLRMEGIGWEETQLVVELDSPPTRIVNTGRRTLLYEVKGALTPWSRTLELSPGKEHEFETPYPLIFRPRNQPEEQWVPVGTRFEYGGGSRE